MAYLSMVSSYPAAPLWVCSSTAFDLRPPLLSRLDCNVVPYNGNFQNEQVKREKGVLHVADQQWSTRSVTDVEPLRLAFFPKWQVTDRHRKT
eukprot:922431-Amphidinium_carterae.1